MKGIHFICHRDMETKKLEGLVSIGDDRYTSCCWAITLSEAREVKGGMMFLHETKRSKSRYGGKVLCFREVPNEVPDTIAPYRVELTFEYDHDARGREWPKGLPLSDRSWTSGVVEIPEGKSP